jgi:hypothetical protein
MGLTNYFETAEGTGVLATADSDGNVDLAIYAHPHMENDETVVLVMSDKLSHANLQTNPKAAYMFIEKAKGYQGKRLYLQKLREENDPELVQSIRRRKRYGGAWEQCCILQSQQDSTIGRGLDIFPEECLRMV